MPKTAVLRRITSRRLSACLVVVVAASLCSGCVTSYDGAVRMARDEAASSLEYAVTSMGELSDSANIGLTIDRDDFEDYTWGLLLSESDRADPEFRSLAVTSFTQDGRSLEVRIFVRDAATFSRGLASTSASVHGCAALRTVRDGSVSVSDVPCDERLAEVTFEESTETSLADLHASQD
ncbi:hypothetical protein [Microbacterium sulfonylureivorans]|uniref:hypothetical protein n=1 Tax=Microbacterium sulfonylureivorans TaxID=2486854 RepID=UPI000FDB9796|nr:hypothetical protein [Microbacterium sulfonylureivorans]